MTSTYISLLLLVTWDLLSRVVFIANFPPLLSSQSINLRLLAVVMSGINIILIYKLGRDLFSKRKIALLSAWVLMILPWSIEQGRIASSANISLSFFILGLVILISKLKPFRKVFFSLITVLFTIYFFPKLWFLQNTPAQIRLDAFINNVLYLTSPEFLFFKNSISWWEGVRYFGIFFISLLPFLLSGLYNLINYKTYIPLLGVGGVLILSALSPFFPQSKEFYLSLPFISLITAFGIFQFAKLKGILMKVIFYSLIILTIYEIFQFFHFYYFHYSLQVLEGASHLNEPF